LANAKVDSNYEGTKLAVTDDANETTQPLLVEPILDYLMIDVVFIASSLNVASTAKMDANYEGVAQAFDGTSPRPLKVNPANDRLLIDLTII
jgi:hypothetical protein